MWVSIAWHPNHLTASNNQTARVDPRLVSLAEDAVRQYEEAGGHITQFSEFGADPLANDSTLVLQCEQNSIDQRYPDFDHIFHKLVSGDDTALH